MRLVTLLCLIGALAAGGRAWAHAQLVAAEPRAGAVVAEAPGQVVLRFNEPITALSARWFPPAGDPIDVTPKAEGATLRVPVPDGLGEGSQTLSWRVVSADGHPRGASHVFSIGAPSPAATQPPAAGTAWRAALSRGLLTLALVIGAGGAVYARLVVGDAAPRGRAGRLALAAALASPAAALLALGMQGLDLLGDPGASLADPASWSAAASSPFARSAAAAVVAGVAAAAALRRSGAAGACLALAAWGLAAISLALSGHAATASPTWLTAPSLAVHAGVVVFWVGALPCLLSRAAAGGAGLAPVLRRFARIATPLVAVLIATGVALAVVQVGRPGALIETSYGRMLVAKLVAVLALLALAALNRLRLTPAIAAGKTGAERAFRRSVGAEIALGLLIIALASGFRLTPPPRALDAASAELYVHLHGRSAMADVLLRPGRAGPNAVEIGLADANSAPLDAQEVSIAFADPATGVEPIAIEAARDGELWRAGPVHLPRAGQWSLTLHVLVDDFEQETLQATASLPD